MNPALLQQRDRAQGRFASPIAAITAFYDSDGRERIARALAPAFERALGSAAVLDAIDHAIECALTSLRPAADAQTPTPYYSGGELYAFTLQAARRHLIDQQRRPGLRPTAGASDQMPAVSETLADSHAATPEERWIETELAHQVREAAAGLDELTLEVLWLRHVEGLKKPQIEARLGLTAKRLRLLLHAGNEKLCALFRGVEAGTTCGGRRESVLRLAFDLAGGQEARRARAHVGHCRECALRFARAQAYRRAVAGLVPFPPLAAHAGAAGGLLTALRHLVARLLGHKGAAGSRALGAQGSGIAAGGTKLAAVGAAGLALAGAGLYTILHNAPAHRLTPKTAVRAQARPTTALARTSSPPPQASREHAALVRAHTRRVVLQKRRAAKQRAAKRAARRRAARQARSTDEFFSSSATPSGSTTTSAPATTTTATVAPQQTSTSSAGSTDEFPAP